MLKRDFARALGLFVAAGITDSLDGFLARLLRQKTLLGMYLDPIADKLLLSSCFVVLAMTGQVPWLVTGIVLGRDVIILLAVLILLLTTSLRQFPPSVVGKANTVVQVAAVFCVMLDNLYARAWLDSARHILMVLVPTLVLASGLHYAYLTARKLWNAAS